MFCLKTELGLSPSRLCDLHRLVLFRLRFLGDPAPRQPDDYYHLDDVAFGSAAPHKTLEIHNYGAANGLIGTGPDLSLADNLVSLCLTRNGLEP